MLDAYGGKNNIDSTDAFENVNTVYGASNEPQMAALVKLIALETNRGAYTLNNIGADNRVDEKIQVLEYTRRNYGNFTAAQTYNLVNAAAGAA